MESDETEKKSKKDGEVYGAKAPAWDKAKVVAEVENRLPSIFTLWCKIILWITVGLLLSLSILALAIIQLTSFSILFMQEGIQERNI